MLIQMFNGAQQFNIIKHRHAPISFDTIQKDKVKLPHQTAKRL